jgi:hypothetical protein
VKIVCNVRKFPNQLQVGTGLNAGFRKVAREGILTTLENGDEEERLGYEYEVLRAAPWGRERDSRGRG